MYLENRRAVEHIDFCHVPISMVLLMMGFNKINLRFSASGLRFCFPVALNYYYPADQANSPPPTCHIEMEIFL